MTAAALRVHRIALDPNNLQRPALARAAGVARFAWNWALAEWQRQYRAGQRPNEAALRRDLNARKRVDWPWMLESPKAAPQQAVKDLGAAWQRFFTGKARKPRFKKKGVHDAFRADNGPETVAVSGRRIRLPKIGWVRMRERRRFAGRIKSAQVTRDTNRWFVALTVEIDAHHIDAVNTGRESQGPVGVDLGVKDLAVVSDGTRFPAPKALDRNLKKLRRPSRRHSRKQRGSACGNLHDGLQLSERSWTCGGCGRHHDRDLNAAVNLKNLAASWAVTARGEDRPRAYLWGARETASVKREPVVASP